MSFDKEVRINQEWDALAPKDWGVKKHADERAMLSGLLAADESLAGLVSGDFALNGGFAHTNLGIATDRRLIFLRQTKRANEVVELPYATIESISSNIGLMGGVVKGSAGTKGRFEMLNIYPKHQAESFADTVQSLVTQMRERGIPAAEVAPPVSIERAEADGPGMVWVEDAVEEQLIVPTGEPASVTVGAGSRLDSEWNDLAPADWGSKKHANERAMLSDLLEAGEPLECLVSGDFASAGALVGHSNLGVATDRRLIFLRQTKRANEVVSLPYATIESFSGNIGLMGGVVKVSAGPNGSFEMVNIYPKKQAELFADTVRPHIPAAQAEENPANLSKEYRIDQEWNSLIPKGWGSFGDAGMHSGERKMLYSLLESDEHLECLCGGVFKTNYGVVVATDRRVIFLDKGIVSTEVAELTYKSIESISYSGGMMWGSLKFGLVGATTLPIENVKPKEQAKVFADTVRKHLNAGQPVAAPTVVQTASAMDELEKAAALYERGLLTPEEFAAKKAQLLNS